MAMLNNQILFGDISKPWFPLDLPWTIPLDASSLKKNVCTPMPHLFPLKHLITSYNPIESPLFSLQPVHWNTFVLVKSQFSCFCVVEVSISVGETTRLACSERLPRRWDHDGPGQILGQSLGAPAASSADAAAARCHCLQRGNHSPLFFCKST